MAAPAILLWRSFSLSAIVFSRTYFVIAFPKFYWNGPNEDLQTWTDAPLGCFVVFAFDLGA